MQYRNIRKKVKDSGILPLEQPKRMRTNVTEGNEAERWKKEIKGMAHMETDDEETTPISVDWNSNLIPNDDKTNNTVLHVTNQHFVALLFCFNFYCFIILTLYCHT